MKVHNEPIPDGKLGQFDEILKLCGGRYLQNPIEAPDQYGRYRVSYQYDNMAGATQHEEKWKRITSDIRETTKPRGLSAILLKTKHWLLYLFGPID